MAYEIGHTDLVAAIYQSVLHLTWQAARDGERTVSTTFCLPTIPADETLQLRSTPIESFITVSNHSYLSRGSYVLKKQYLHVPIPGFSRLACTYCRSETLAREEDFILVHFQEV